jgi:hypothetical protein
LVNSLAGAHLPPDFLCPNIHPPSIWLREEAVVSKKVEDESKKRNFANVREGRYKRLTLLQDHRTRAERARPWPTVLRHKAAVFPPTFFPRRRPWRHLWNQLSIYWMLSF